MSGEYAGTVLNVSAAPLGDVLAADAASGATTLYVTDTSDFDPAEGGFLSINGETIQYTAVDDDAETITLVSGISAGATADDAVYVWDVGLAEIAKEYRALVAVPGALGNDDALDVLVAQSLAPLLPEGLRDPGTGESVVLEQQGTDWVIIDVRGKKPQIQPPFASSGVGILGSAYYLAPSPDFGPNDFSGTPDITGDGAACWGYDSGSIVALQDGVYSIWAGASLANLDSTTVAHMHLLGFEQDADGWFYGVVSGDLQAYVPPFPSFAGDSIGVHVSIPAGSPVAPAVTQCFLYLIHWAAAA